MSDSEIKVFQVDDWAYVAAKTPEEACKFVEEEWSRPDDPDERELVELKVEGHVKEQLDTHLNGIGGLLPALIGVDSHYA